MTAALQIVSGIVISLIWYGMPAAAFAFLLLVLGRKLGGELGMKIAAACGTLIVSMPLLWFVWAFASGTIRHGHFLPLDGKSWALIGMAVSTIAGAMAMFFFSWTDQQARARAT